MNVDGNRSLAELLLERADEKNAELTRLQYEQMRITIKLERVKDYLEKLNGFLEAEGLPRVRVRQRTQRRGFGQPGNRAKGMPLRKPEWDGMSLSEAVTVILSQTDEVVHADTLAHRIFEIETEAEKRKAKHSLVSTLRAGVKGGRWEGLGKNRYRGRTPQRELSLQT